MEFPQGKRPFSQGLSMLFGTDKRESVLMDGGKVKLVCVQVVEPQYGEVYFFLLEAGVRAPAGLLL